MAGYSHKTWICPYFQWDERRKVHCEGRCCVAFPDQKAYEEYTGAFCANRNGGWRRCTIAQALNGYYERKTEGTHGAKQG